MWLNRYEKQGFHLPKMKYSVRSLSNYEHKRDKQKQNTYRHVRNIYRVTSWGSQDFKPMERTAKQDARRSADLKPDK
jgi:hypothetical protein